MSSCEKFFLFDFYELEVITSSVTHNILLHINYLEFQSYYKYGMYRGYRYYDLKNRLLNDRIFFIKWAQGKQTPVLLASLDATVLAIFFMQFYALCDFNKLFTLSYGNQTNILWDIYDAIFFAIKIYISHQTIIKPFIILMEPTKNESTPWFGVYYA